MLKIIKINFNGKATDVQWEIIKDMENIVDGKLKGRAFTFRIKNFYDGLKSSGKTISFSDTQYREAYWKSLTALNAQAEKI